MSSTFRVEVGTVSCDPAAWSGNALTFPTQEAAEEYARDLFGRWTAVTRWRVLDTRGNVIKTVDYSSK